MRSALGRLFGSLRSGLATGMVVGLAVMLPVMTTAQTAIVIEGSLTAANITAGDTEYKDSVDATYDQIVKLQVYYRNTEAAESNRNATNLRVKVTMPTQAGTNQQVSTSIKGDNSNEVKDQVTVKVDQENATLQYIPGSAVWKHNTGSREQPKIEETRLSDEVVSGAQGMLLENVKPADTFAATVTVLARVMMPGVSVVTESQLQSDTNKWSTNNSAKPGDTLKYIISYQNTSNVEQRQVIVRNILPAKLQLVPGSTTLFNTTSQAGVKQPDDVASAGGLNIGNYGPGANAYVIFEAKLPAADQLSCGNNEFRNVGSVRPTNMNEYYNNAVTTVNRECTTPKTTTAPAAKPVYSCDLLTVTKAEGRKLSAKVDYTAKDGAKLKTIAYDFGDGSQPLVTDKTTVEYTYTKDGNFTVSAKLTVTAAGKDEVTTSAACAKPISFIAPTATPPASTPAAGKSDLPATGVGNVVGLFGLTSLVGFIGHRLFLARRIRHY